MNKGNQLHFFYSLDKYYLKYEGILVKQSHLIPWNNYWKKCRSLVHAFFRVLIILVFTCTISNKNAFGLY